MARGVFYGIATSLALASISIGTHAATIEIGDLILLRGIAISLFFLPFAWKEIPVLVQKESKVIWFRGIAGAIGMILFLMTQQMGHIGLANSLGVTTQVFVPILAFTLLREKVGFWQVIGISVIITGVSILNGVVLGTWEPTLTVLGLLGAFFASLSFIFLRQIAGQFSVALLVWQMAICTCAAGLLFPHDLLSMWRGLGDPWVLLVIVASLIMQITLTLTFRYIDASRGVILIESFLVWSGIAFLFSANKPFLWSEFATYGLIMCGVAIAQKRSKAANS